MPTPTRRAAIAAVGACLAVLAPLAAGATPAPPPQANNLAIYQIPGTDTDHRTAIAHTGALVIGEHDGTATVEATPQQADALRKAGYTLNVLRDESNQLNARPAGAPRDFPPGDEAYHTYERTVDELNKAAQAHPDLAATSSAGKSFEGRNIPMLKISGNAHRDDNKPEVLFTCNQHAREHLTTEMCLHIVKRLTDGYAKDPSIKRNVDSHVIWVVPMANPDGSSYDVQTGKYQNWRKNRQDTGTDINRNWGYNWGCCGGSSDDPNDETYRGKGPFSAPETAAIRDFVNSRVIGGQQRIKANIDFHTYSELVMWPYGYTKDHTGPGMTQQEYDRFARVGTEMAKTNGYTPEQSSSLYVTDGDINDWMWHDHKILSFTFEMYPKPDDPQGFYPPGNVIDRETARNDAATDILLREAHA